MREVKHPLSVPGRAKAHAAWSTRRRREQCESTASRGRRCSRAVGRLQRAEQIVQQVGQAVQGLAVVEQAGDVACPAKEGLSLLEVPE